MSKQGPFGVSGVCADAAEPNATAMRLAANTAPAERKSAYRIRGSGKLKCEAAPCMFTRKTAGPES